MNFDIRKDLMAIREIYGYSQIEIANLTGIDLTTINRIEKGEIYPSDDTIRKIYDFAHRAKLELNKIKALLHKEEAKNDSIILFHGSEVVTELDSIDFLDGTKTIDDIFLDIVEEYGESSYGKNKFDKESMYWIGYIHRHFSYTYELSSKRVYKIVKPRELYDMHLPYHTPDPKQTIERILEEKNISFDPDALFKRSYEIYKRIHMESKRKG